MSCTCNYEVMYVLNTVCMLTMYVINVPVYVFLSSSNFTEFVRFVLLQFLFIYSLLFCINIISCMNIF